MLRHPLELIEMMALGLALVRKTKGGSPVLLFFLSKPPPRSMSMKSLGKSSLIADAPAVYNRERSARQVQNDLAFFSDVLDLMLLLNAETGFWQLP